MTITLASLASQPSRLPTESDSKPPVDVAEPPRGSGIPPATWEQICQYITTEAERYSHFWPCWCDISRRYLRRYSGREATCPHGATVFYRLFDLYKAAGGKGSTFCEASEASNREVSAA